MKALNKIYYSSDEDFSQENSNIFFCEFFKNNNKCELPSSNNFKTLNIITYGNAKKEKIELKLPLDHFYSIENHEVDIFCEDGIHCVLVFEAVLFPGINEFKLASKDKSQMQDDIAELQISSDQQHSGRDFSISINR